jgi:phospholipid transport system substrate-binding protein
MLPKFVRFATAAATAAVALGAALLAGAPGAAAQAQAQGAQASAAQVSAEMTAPDVLVKTVTLEVVDIIQKDKEIQKGDKKKVIALIETKVLPHFNFQTMTSSAVGRNWDKASAVQRARLQEEFKTLLVRTYSSAIAAYSNQKFEFRPLRAKPTDTDVTVNVRVMQGGSQPVTIDYDMEKRPTGWKVWDVRVGGISLVANYRTEFDNLVRERGIDGLLKALQAKNSSNETPAPLAIPGGAPKK